MEGAKQRLELLSTVFTVAPIPEPFEAALESIPNNVLQILTIAEAMKWYVRGVKALAAYIADVTIRAMEPCEAKAPGSLDRSPKLMKRIEEFGRREIEILESWRPRDRVFGYAKELSKIAAMKKGVDDVINLIQLEIAVAANHKSKLRSQAQERSVEQKRLMFQRAEAGTRMDIPSELKYRSLMSTLFKVEHQIARLDFDKSSAFKTPPCLSGTRKSSVAATIANQAEQSHHPGERFYFTRNEQGWNECAVMIIERQLAGWGDRGLRVYIAAAIQDVPDLTRMTLEIQFENLIQRPPETLDSTCPSFVIVLDALDECDNQYAALLLRLIKNGLARLPDQVKFFVTSRGEPHLQQFYTSDSMRNLVRTYTLDEET
ncbi:hypothetical protein FRB96_002536 [Tulasnella sp. 330]|nr:hypothetical protein FRB96_002536 [Tulasnella sp. 330]